MQFSNKDLRRLIVPLILEQLLATTIGLADTIMVASCGEAAVSGVSLVDSINFLFITMFTALATGGSVVAAQYLGKGSREGAARSANQLFYFSLMTALLIAAVVLSLRYQILRTIYGQIDADVMENAIVYFTLSALSYPFLAAYNSGAALFRAMGDSRTSMYTSFIMNGLNVAGNALFIYGFHMGVAGAALASLISRAVGSVLITFLLLDRRRTICYSALHRIRLIPDMIMKILHIGVPNGIENSIFQIGKILVASIISVLGTSSITANAVCSNLASIQITPGVAIGVAMITVVGQCVGAQDYDNARKYIKKLMFIAYAAMWVTTALLLLFHDQVLGLYGLSEETHILAWQCFLIHCIACIVMWAPAFALPNALRAANDVRFTMYASIGTLIVLRLSLTWLLIRVLGMGVQAVWIAMITDWVGRSALFLWRVKGDRWTTKKLL